MPPFSMAAQFAWKWPWIAPGAFALALIAVAIVPASLLPIAQGIHAACERIPVLSTVTRHVPPLFLAYLVTLLAGFLLCGFRAGVIGLTATRRFNRNLANAAQPLPDRLLRLGEGLGITDRLTYLRHPRAMAFCYGFLKPRIAVTAGLLARLDDAQLLAVLAHEQEHLRRRDPLRYLLIDAVAKGAFVVPIASTWRHRKEAEIELAADRAALAVAPRAALAGALLAVLSSPSPAAAGLAGLSATEARIANLSGRAVLPTAPARAVAATAMLATILLIVGARLAFSVGELGAACMRCVGA